MKLVEGVGGGWFGGWGAKLDPGRGGSGGPRLGFLGAGAARFDLEYIFRVDLAVALGVVVRFGRCKKKDDGRKEGR